MTKPKKSNGYDTDALNDYYDQVDEEGRITIGGLLSDFEETWQDDKRREKLLWFIRTIEDEPSLLGLSAHIIAIAIKQA